MENLVGFFMTLWSIVKFIFQPATVWVLLFGAIAYFAIKYYRKNKTEIVAVLPKKTDGTVNYAMTSLYVAIAIIAIGITYLVNASGSPSTDTNGEGGETNAGVATTTQVPARVEHKFDPMVDWETSLMQAVDIEVNSSGWTEVQNPTGRTYAVTTNGIAMRVCGSEGGDFPFSKGDTNPIPNQYLKVLKFRSVASGGRITVFIYK